VVGEVQASRRGEQFSSKTGQSLISPRRLETSARSRRCCKASVAATAGVPAVDRWARDRATGGLIGREVG